MSKDILEWRDTNYRIQNEKLVITNHLRRQIS